MSLDPVQVMKGQDPMPNTCPPASNGDSKASWEDSKDIHENMGTTKKPKSVSVPFVISVSQCICASDDFPITSVLFFWWGHTFADYLVCEMFSYSE